MSERENHPQRTSRRIESPGYLSFSKNTIVGIAAIAVGGGLAAGLASFLYTNSWQRLMLAYLVALMFVLSLSLGSLFFVLIQHLTRAGWAVVIRRPAEVFALNVITVAVLALPIVWNTFSGERSIYPWARGSNPNQLHSESEHASVSATIRPRLVSANAASREPGVSHAIDGAPDSRAASLHSHLYVHQTFDALTRSKTGWLNPTFFLLRLIAYFAVWIAIAWFYFSRSRHQDEAGGTADTLRMEWWSGPSIFAFGLTLTFASFDLLMSLDPHWYSTIFGVYYFAGCAVAGFALSLLSWLILAHLGLSPVGVSNAQFRDLGRLLFAFVFFWGYIAFSQYMLLWYANIPETTRWLAVRGASLAEGYRNSWGIVLVLLLFGHFIIPFLGIMSRHVKGNPPAMIFWTIWLLVMHYFDLYWLVMPEFRSSITFGLPELGTLALVVGIYLIGASFLSTRTALLPIGDPRLQASLATQDAY